jgi:hypothetical protein
MKRAYAFLSLLIITSALRVPSFAQKQPNQSPTITRPTYTEEALRRRISAPSVDAPRAPSEEPILRVETSVLRLPDPNAGLGPGNAFLRSVSTIYDAALFQRQRFRENGQWIEFERGFLYFRQDRYVVTKGFIFYRAWNDRIDFGLYKRSFHDDAAPSRGQAMWFGLSDPTGRNGNSNSGKQIFFGVRFNLDKNTRPKR